MKRNAKEHPEKPPAKIIRNNIAQVHDAVLPYFPERNALFRSLNRRSQRDLPSNPLILVDMTAIAAQTFKNAVHQLLSLVFVSVDDVPAAFDELYNAVPERIQHIMDHFNVTFIRGRPARGWRRPVPPRYMPNLWNQYLAAMGNEPRTNNMIEALHLRFQVRSPLLDHPLLGFNYSERIGFHSRASDMCSYDTGVEGLSSMYILCRCITDSSEDAAPSIMKVAASLSALYPKMVHVTCLAHALHRVAEEVWTNFPQVELDA
ncbi:hypothetical protein C0J52_23372 [Blattella germanica]|nr:hypothetical protein C0J52_23372 [Blattella germanica]